CTSQTFVARLFCCESCAHTRTIAPHYRVTTGVSADALRTVATDRLGIGGIGAHVDAALPLALERVGDLERHTSDPFDLDVDGLAVLHRPQPFLSGAPRDHA